MERFKRPENADPSYNLVTMICPTDKRERGVGLNWKEEGEFGGICKLGTDTLIACYANPWGEKEYYSASDLWLMCRKCSNRWEKGRFDPFYNSIFDGWCVEEKLRRFLDEELEDTKFFVYFVSDAHYMKIGVAENPKKRLSELQTGNPNPLTIVYLVPCRSKKAAFEAEMTLHNLYSSYRMEGEWFNILDKIDKKSFELMFPANL